MRYKDFSISVLKQQAGSWVATVETLGPQRGAMAVPGPGQGEPGPGEFGSEDAAMDAAKAHIDRHRAQR